MKSNARKAEIRKRLKAFVPLASMADMNSMETVAIAGHLRHLPPATAAWQAVTTHIRHVHTDYDKMLLEGYDAESARHFVLDDINKILADWGCGRKLQNSE